MTVSVGRKYYIKRTMISEKFIKEMGYPPVSYFEVIDGNVIKQILLWSRQKIIFMDIDDEPHYFDSLQEGHVPKEGGTVEGLAIFDKIKKYEFYDQWKK